MSSNRWRARGPGGMHPNAGTENHSAPRKNETPKPPLSAEELNAQARAFVDARACVRLGFYCGRLEGRTGARGPVTGTAAYPSTCRLA